MTTMSSSPHRCPTCYGDSIERLPRRGLIQRLILPLLGRRVYSCRDCGRRFLDRPSGQVQPVSWRYAMPPTAPVEDLWWTPREKAHAGRSQSGPSGSAKPPMS